MSVLRTVPGDRAPSDPGGCCAHEPGIIDPRFTTQAAPEFLPDDVERSTTELREFHAAAAEVPRRTGAPILTQTQQGTLGLEEVARVRALGVDLRHVCLSHLDQKPDPADRREMLASGVRVDDGRAFRWRPEQGNWTREVVVALLPECPGRITLALDAARRGYWRSPDVRPGLSFLLNEFSAQPRAAGMTDAQWPEGFFARPAATDAFHQTLPHEKNLENRRHQF